MTRVLDQYRGAVLTTANQLTILRIVFVPVFIILLAYHEVGWALSTFVAAGVTDVLDGIIARRFRQKTSIGAVLDPLADKLLMVSSIILLSLPQMGFVNSIPRWLMILIIFRDVFILLVSPASMASDWVDREIAIIHARQARGEPVHFYPLVLTPTPKAGLDRVRGLNLRPRDGKPLSGYDAHDRARQMDDIANEIADIRPKQFGARRWHRQRRRSVCPHLCLPRSCTLKFCG